MQPRAGLESNRDAQAQREAACAKKEVRQTGEENGQVQLHTTHRMVREEGNGLAREEGKKKWLQITWAKALGKRALAWFQELPGAQCDKRALGKTA